MWGRVFTDSHVSIGLCAHGQGTDHWLTLFSELLAEVAANSTSENTRLLREGLLGPESADLLLVDTSVNDGPVCFGVDCWTALWPQVKLATQAGTELLINQVRIAHGCCLRDL